jgi:CubicO group peptidase (beta-lactamase class C family)
MLHRLRGRGLLLVIFFIAGACTPGPPAPPTPPAASVQSAIASYLKDVSNDDSFSGAALVAKDYVPFASAVNGLGDRQRAWYISTQTNLNIDSITRLFTAAAIGQLVDAGKIAFDDPLSKFLPSYPKPMGDRITVAMLLANTAGAGDYLSDPGYARVKDTFGSLDELVAAVDTSVPAGTTPGAAYKYSSTGYLLLGSVIQKASGRDYYDYMDNEIFGRAGIAGGFLANTQDEHSVRQFALGYLPDGTTNWRNLPARGTPASGAYVSAKDLVAFHRALASGTLVSAETLRKLVLEPPTAGRSPLPITANTWVGAEPGASSVFAMTENGYTVVVLANVSGAARPIADKLLAMVRGA